MILFIMMLIAVIILLIYVYKDMSKEEEKRKERYMQENIMLEKTIIHLNGHPYLKEQDIIEFQIKNNNTIYFRKENINTGMEIPISKLLKYEIKTESEIRHDVTLTRLLTLGIFAFGIKKKSKIEEQFLIISYIQNDVNIQCVFKQCDGNQQLGDIVNTLNFIKIEKIMYKKSV